MMNINPKRVAYTEKSDLVFEGTIHEVVNIGGGKFKAQAQTNEEDLNWLVVFNVEKRLKGQYEHDTIGITVHSPALTFGHTKSSTINKHRLYLKSSPTDLRDYLVVGNELLRDDDQ